MQQINTLTTRPAPKLGQHVISVYSAGPDAYVGSGYSFKECLEEIRNCRELEDLLKQKSEQEDVYLPVYMDGTSIGDVTWTGFYANSKGSVKLFLDSDFLFSLDPDVAAAVENDCNEFNKEGEDPVKYSAKSNLPFPDVKPASEFDSDKTKSDNFEF